MARAGLTKDDVSPGGVTVTDTGSTALTGWTVTFTFGGDQQVTSCPSVLITDYAGDPTPYGAACQAILQALPG